MTPLYDFTTEWTEDERRNAAKLLTQAAGCLHVYAAMNPHVTSARTLAVAIDAALGLPTKNSDWVGNLIHNLREQAA
jgi:hypothetical protein